MAICSDEMCERAALVRGMCTMHYQRWKRAGGVVAPSCRGVPAIERLLSRCRQDGDCWTYTGPLDFKGYSRIRGEGGKREFGHWISWKYFREDRPPGLSYDHLCRNRACVNPWHGDPVPAAVNNQRAPECRSTVNSMATHCPSGHEYSPENTYVNDQGWRWCRPCHNEANRLYRARKKMPK